MRPKVKEVLRRRKQQVRYLDEELLKRLDFLFQVK